ncbi:ABC transporter permease [Celeribacter naphthalenivorans]|uniref:ABC transporter permease n=1 Tax=Celeribacter naphthalenivorans TaxID=1614694 RepID=UPI001CF9AB63|nr:ABC transporter permease [Celeribacter naphthalenivorans]
MKKNDRDIRWLPGLSWLTALFFLFLYTPLLVLVVFSFNASRSTTVWSGFSLEWYHKAFTNDAIRVATQNSVIIATLAAILATTIATSAALALARNKRMKGKQAFHGAMLLPLMIPEIVTAVATLIFFSTIGLGLGLGNIILAHTVFCIPFAYLPIKARLESMDENLEMAARDLYADKWATLRFVTLPLVMPGIISGAMLAFIISLDDFIITLMLAQAGSTTLPIYIYSFVRVGITPEINAVSTILIGFSVIVVSVSAFLGRKTAS